MEYPELNIKVDKVIIDENKVDVVKVKKIKKRKSSKNKISDITDIIDNNCKNGQNDDSSDKTNDSNSNSDKINDVCNRLLNDDVSIKLSNDNEKRLNDNDKLLNDNDKLLNDDNNKQLNDNDDNNKLQDENNITNKLTNENYCNHIIAEYNQTGKNIYKNFYCVNCNAHGHTSRSCKIATISNGIIAFHINFNGIQKNIKESELILKIGEVIKNEFKENNKSCARNDYKTYSIYRNYVQENMIKEKINENIKFLMVQRKNSLGYIEFIRGRYNLSNLPSVINLFEQMIESEIRDIINNDYHTLWLNLWQNDASCDLKKNTVISNEYKKSKLKFESLKKSYINIILNAKTHFSFNEWGFPKGRRKPYESDLACGIREFEEETKQSENTYQIIDNCIQIRENLVGTNDIFYIHNYHLAYLKSDELNFNITSDNIKEIGDIKLFNVNECLKFIRPYHYNKINIIKNIYEIINNFLS